MLFIYLLEANPIFGPRVQRMHQAMLQRGDILCTGVFTIGEVLTGPRKRKDRAGIAGLKKFFASKDVEILPFDLDAADRYSIIRASLKVGQADAIHLATAAVAGIDLFITNDGEIRKLAVPGIRFFADLDGKVL
jgi:predicted nucleic acid-binding protein